MQDCLVSLNGMFRDFVGALPDLKLIALFSKARLFLTCPVCVDTGTQISAISNYG